MTRIASVSTCGFINRLGLAIILSVCSPAFLVAQIENGDFSQPGTTEPFEGWRTDLDVGDRPEDGGEIVLFEVVDRPQVEQLETDFEHTILPSTLSFEYSLEVEDGGTDDANGLPIAFRLPFTIRPTSRCCHRILVNLICDRPSTALTTTARHSLIQNFVQVEEIDEDTKRVNLDLSTVGSASYLLEFLVAGDDDGKITKVLLDNVIVPEPTSLPILAPRNTTPSFSPSSSRVVVSRTLNLGLSSA